MNYRKTRRESKNPFNDLREITNHNYREIFGRIYPKIAKRQPIFLNIFTTNYETRNTFYIINTRALAPAQAQTVRMTHIVVLHLTSLKSKTPHTTFRIHVFSRSYKESMNTIAALLSPTTTATTATRISHIRCIPIYERNPSFVFSFRRRYTDA